MIEPLLFNIRSFMGLVAIALICFAPCRSLSVEGINLTGNWKAKVPYPTKGEYEIDLELRHFGTELFGSVRLTDWKPSRVSMGTQHVYGILRGAVSGNGISFVLLRQKWDQEVFDDSKTEWKFQGSALGDKIRLTALFPGTEPVSFTAERVTETKEKPVNGEPEGFDISRAIISAEHIYRTATMDQLVAMITGELDGAETIGAGIVFGYGGDNLYIATANHVVRRGTTQAEHLKVTLRSMPGEPLTARVLDHKDLSLDLAVLEIRRVDALAIPIERLPFDQLGDARTLKRGDFVRSIGYARGMPWHTNVAPDRIYEKQGDVFFFESNFIGAGQSGGALTNDRNKLVAMVTSDYPPNGAAVSLQKIVAILKKWQFPVMLRPPDNTHIKGVWEANRVRYWFGEKRPYKTFFSFDASGGNLLGELKNSSAYAAKPIWEGAIDRNKIAFRVYSSISVSKGTGINTRYVSHQIPVDFRGFVFKDRIYFICQTSAGWPLEEFIAKRFSASLHKAAQEGHADKVKSLLENGAQIDTKDPYGRTPLSLAVSKGQVRVVRLLLQAGADANTSDDFKNSPLHSVAAGGYPEVAKILMTYQADTAAMNSDKNTPLHLAAERGHMEITALLLSRGVDVDSENDDKNTPLHMAAEKGFPEIISVLIGHGAYVNAVNHRGMTPLIFAVDNNSIEAVKILIKNGADVNYGSRSDSKALHLAVEKGLVDVINILLDAGADLNAKDKLGDTPLHVAASADNANALEVASLLISKGAQINLENRKSETPLSIAIRRGSEIVSLLRSHGGRE